MTKFAVVGMGRIGMVHLRECPMAEGFKIAAVCDIDPAALEKATSESKLPGFTSYEKMLKEVDADVVTIATPSHLHYRMTLQALKAGFNVLVEKPMAGNLLECRQMHAAAVKARRFLTVNQCKRFQPDTEHLRQVIHSGKIGDIYSMYTSTYGFTERTDWQIWKKYNGGMLANWGVHLVDAILYLLGEEPASVFAKLNRIVDRGNAEDSFKTVIRFKNGAVGEAEAVRSVYPKPLWHIAGTKGSILCENTGAVNEFKTTVVTRTGMKESVHKIDWRQHPYVLQPHYAALKKSLKNTGKPVVSIQSVLKTMAVLDATRKSSVTGNSVKIIR
jgi:scyllo-inositol 2-dehydrogenase (NADP+)